jgi:hypothetical protein
MNLRARATGVYGVSAVFGLSIALSMMPPAWASAADQPVMTPGGGQRPPGGDRSDEQQPQLGSGNRGSGLRGSDASVNPSRVRKAAPAGTVTGDVLEIDGKTYIVRDAKGNEITLRTDEQTRIDGVIRIGARVVADVDRNGHVGSIARAQ